MYAFNDQWISLRGMKINDVTSAIFYLTVQMNHKLQRANSETWNFEPMKTDEIRPVSSLIGQFVIPSCIVRDIR